MNIEEAGGVRFATKLTRRELQAITKSHYLGSWCWQGEGLHYVTFLPNVMHIDGGDLPNVVRGPHG